MNWGVAVDSSGNVYIADAGNRRVLKETLSGTTYVQSIIADSSTLGRVDGLAVDAGGSVYMADYGAGRVLKATPSGDAYHQSTVPTSTLNNVSQVAVDASGNVYVADSGNNRVLKETVAGNSYVESQISTASGLDYPIGVVVDRSGNIFIADSNNNRVLRESPSGNGYAEAIVASGLNGPWRIALDASGDVLIADYGDSRLLKAAPSANGGYAVSTIFSAPGFGMSDVASDTSGNLYVALAASNQTIKLQTASGNFGDASVSQAPQTLGLVFTADTPGTLGGVAAVTEGAQGLDFTVVSLVNCASGTSLNVGDSCLAYVQFSPKLPGVRLGAVQLLGSSGSVIATGYVAGTGTGPQVSFSPGTPTPIASGLMNPRGIATDAAGNVYIADTDHQEILKATVSGGNYQVATLANSGLRYPNGIAIDGSGSLYVADYLNNRVLKETPASGGYVESVFKTASPLSSALRVTVDAGGNLYIADSGNKRILKETVNGSTYVETIIPTPELQAGSGAQKSLDGVAVDAGGNVYYSDRTNNVVMKETLARGVYTESTVSSGSLKIPLEIVVDASGAIYVADSGNNRVMKETPSGNSYIESIAVPATAGLAAPNSLALDGNGNLYIANTGSGNVVKVDVADPPSLSFASTAVGATTAAQTIAITNIGNSPLTFPVPSSGNNPAVSTNYTLDASAANACPQTTAGGAASPSLAPGASCALAIRFAPTRTGSLQGDLVVGDTNLNAANAMQSIALSGTGTTALASLALSAPASAVYGNAVTVSASVTNEASQGPVNGGTVAFSDGISSFGSQPVANGSAASSYLAPHVGSFTLSGSFIPGDGNTTKAQGQTTIQITPAPLTIAADNATRLYGAADPQFTGAITGAINSDSFTEVLKVSATASSPVGSYPIVPSASGANLASYTQNVQNGTLQVTAASLTATADDATRLYGATNPAFTGSISGQVNGDALTETFSTTATGASPVAKYDIVPGIFGVAAKNYNPTLKKGTLTVTPAGLTVSAHDATRVYGAVNPSFTGAITGAVNGDSFTESFTTSATQSSPVGTYAVMPEANGTALSNYKLTVQKGFLIVSQAALSVKANDATRPYGAPNPSFTGAITGAASGDTLTERFTTVAAAATAPGTYAIVPSAQGSTVGNYAVTAVNGTLTITPTQLTASAGNVTRVYGAANPAFTGTVMGAANNEGFTETFTTAATAQSAVGVYKIEPALAGATLGSYQPVAVAGQLTVTPAPLTATAASFTRPYGAPNPALTGTLVGVVNGDALAASYSTPALATDAPGQYPILVSVSGAALGNYALGQSNGVLTIAKAATTAGLTYDPSDATQLLVQVQPATTGVPTGSVRLLHGTQALGEAALVNGSATFAASLLPAGSTETLTAAYEGDGNFLPSASTALTVTAAADFSVAPAAGAPTTVIPTAGQAAFLLRAAPGGSGVYPGLVTFSVSGLPEGATAAFSPATLGAGSGAHVVTLTVRMKSVLGTLPVRITPGTLAGRVAPALGGAALAVIMLPWSGARRLRRGGVRLLLLCLLAVSAIGGVGALTGCGVTSTRDALGAKQTSYPLTITMTSGGISRTTTATLTVGQ